MSITFWRAAFILGAFTQMGCLGVCGDGLIDGPGGSGSPKGNDDGLIEVCDDGNTINGDGCNDNCFIIQSGFVCTGEPSACTQLAEDCATPGDENVNGASDCADPACTDSPLCVELDCGDGVDNDTASNDNLTDCADPDCFQSPLCIELNCNDGIDNDTAANDGQIDCADADCLSAANCEVAGNGVLTVGSEQCDDGDLIDGDGCSAAMQLEPLSVVTVTPGGAELDQTNTDTAVFGVFFVLDNPLALGGGAVLAFAVTDNPDICNEVERNKVNNGLFDVLPAFTNGLDRLTGTTVVGFIKTEGGDFAAGSFTGNGAPPLTTIGAPVGAGDIITDVGYIVLSPNVDTIFDSTAASDGAGVITLTTFDVVDLAIPGASLPPAGNATIDFTNINMLGKFAANPDQDLDGDGVNETVAINQQISGTILATSCGLSFVQ